MFVTPDSFQSLAAVATEHLNQGIFGRGSMLSFFVSE
jgi:hypothetical protein